MNYEYEEAYHQAVEELYSASLEVQKQDVIIEGANSHIFDRYRLAWESFSLNQNMFFGDTLNQK